MKFFSCQRPAAGIAFVLLTLVSAGTVLDGKIDTHIHAIPPLYMDALLAAGVDDTPSWSLSATEQFLDTVGISLAVLSISTPGVSIVGTGAEARTLARALNNELGNYATNSSRVGFFGTLPDWQDINGTIAEIDYLYTEQKLCNGITAFTSYGGKLLGDPTYQPIWAKLQEHKALVFIHPTGLDVTPEAIGGVLPQYVIDFLWSTTRTAVDLVVTGTMAACPDIDVILAHAAGALPYVVTRALDSLLIPQIASQLTVSYSQAQADFARFYTDLALSASPAQLDGLLDFWGPSNVVMGTDFPYAPDAIVNVTLAQLMGYQSSAPRGSELAFEVLTQNAQDLLNKHNQSC